MSHYPERPKDQPDKVISPLKGARGMSRRSKPGSLKYSTKPCFTTTQN